MKLEVTGPPFSKDIHKSFSGHEGCEITKGATDSFEAGISQINLPKFLQSLIFEDLSVKMLH